METDRNDMMQRSRRSVFPRTTRQLRRRRDQERQEERQGRQEDTLQQPPLTLVSMRPVVESCRQLFSTVRRLEGYSEAAFLVQGTNPAADRLREAEQWWQETLPKNGGVHPWGPPRNAVVLGVMEAARDRVEARPACVAELTAVYPDAERFLKAIFAGLDRVTNSGEFDLFGPFVAYACSRTVGDGRRLLRIRAEGGRLHDVRWRDTEIWGAKIEDILGCVLLLFDMERSTGAPPRGPLERRLERILRGTGEG